MIIAMRKVFSSHVAEIGYDAESQQLHVKFKNGKTAVYLDVPANVADNVITAPSIGEALYKNVRGKFPHGYL